MNKDLNKQKVLILTSPEDIQTIFGDVLIDLAKQITTPEWVSLKEAASLLGISTSSVTLWRTTGKITHTQTSERVYLYSRAHIREILEHNRKRSFAKIDKF